MKKEKQKFGGDWTEEKLERIRKYLVAYATILNKKDFTFAYVDAFAGTGYRENKPKSAPSTLEFEIADSMSGPETQTFLDGSAKIALRVEPQFNKYIFIEKNPARCKMLEALKQEFPDKANRIQIENSDANDFLKNFCKKDWRTRRAVLFLDPFGMQVDWQTITAIAKTEAIDLWLLFPLGSGVSRLLRRDGQISEQMKTKLTSLFGEDAWFDAFYEKSKQASLFGNSDDLEKTASFESISAYFVSRLQTVFPWVHKEPLALYNSKRVPLFLLCFAAGNKKGGKIALKIASDILRR